MGEILDAFLEAFDADETKRCGPRCGHWEDMQEIDRLCALITAVADAEQGNSEAVWNDALTALFAAVGR